VIESAIQCIGAESARRGESSRSTWERFRPDQSGSANRYLSPPQRPSLEITQNPLLGTFIFVRPRVYLSFSSPELKRFI
jgi:hypothetical protein